MVSPDGLSAEPRKKAMKQVFLKNNEGGYTLATLLRTVTP